MESIGLAAIFIPIIVAIAVIGFFMWRHEKKRTERLQALADRHGWRYQAKDDHDRPVRLKSFEPFGQGHTRYCRHLMQGATETGPFEVFEYHYAVTTSNGKSTSTTHYWFQVHHFRMPIRSPGMSIRDEHIGHKLMDAFGGEDVDFESDAFSRKYWVKGEDRRFVYDVIHPGMIEYLHGSKRWVWQWKGESLLVYRAGTFKPERLPEQVAFVEGFRARLPRHLLPSSAPVGGQATPRVGSGRVPTDPSGLLS